MGRRQMWRRGKRPSMVLLCRREIERKQRYLVTAKRQFMRDFCSTHTHTSTCPMMSVAHVSSHKLPFNDTVFVGGRASLRTTCLCLFGPVAQLPAKPIPVRYFSLENFRLSRGPSRDMVRFRCVPAQTLAKPEACCIIDPDTGLLSTAVRGIL